MKKNIIFATAGILAVALTAAAIWAFSEDKKEESAEAKPEPVETPESEEYTDWADVEDPDETDATLNIVEVVNREPSGVMVMLQTATDKPIDIHKWVKLDTLATNEHWRDLLAARGIDHAVVIDPRTFSPDVRAIHRELVTAANGYTVELSMLMDYIVSGNFPAGDVFIEETTGLDLEQLVGTEAFTRLRKWASRPSSMSLLGNMTVIQRWAEYTPGQFIPNVKTMTLRQAADILQNMRIPPRQVLACVHYLTRFLPAEDTRVVEFVETALSRKVARASIAAMRQAGIRDGGVFDYYGQSLSNFSEAELIRVLQVLGKYTVTDNRAKSVIHRYAASK